MSRSDDNRGRSRLGSFAALGLVAALGLSVAVTAATVSAQNLAPTDVPAAADVHNTRAFWAPAAKPSPAPGRNAAVHVRASRSLSLDTASLASVLAQAPRERTPAARISPLVVSFPAPDGSFDLFALEESAIMAPGLAARHPEIKTYRGRGLTDPSATIHADVTPLGFHASVRSASGAWYIDPYLIARNPSVYASYFGRDAKNVHGTFVEREIPSGDFAPGRRSIASTGENLRTYRLALITDPGYATYHLGNTTAAKVALMNRVNQPYEDDLTIRMQLVANNDLLNFDTYAQATAPNGPCGAAPCFTQSQVTGCSSTTRARHVIGQIVGASNYDIGHLALGQPGGGVANLGVVGRSNKAGGCTGIPTPTGDFFAIDYVAHEMGHQFAGNHTFNGNQLNCSGGNRNAANSVEPGSGQSIMAYAGICLTDDEQPHSDGYFSQRSQQEINNYVSSNQAPINEVHTVSLRHFGGGNEVQAVTFGPGYSRVNGISPLQVNINAPPSATSRGGASETGTTVTIATSATHALQVGDSVTVAGVAEAGYNGTFTVTAVPTTRSFQYTNAVTGLPVSGGGTATPGTPGASCSAGTATIRTTAVHTRTAGDVVTISGVGVGGYNGTFTVTNVPSNRTFQYALDCTGLTNSGGGSATYFSPFKVRIGGNDSVLIGGTGLPYNDANLTSAINAIPGFAGTVTVTGAAAPGFTVTYGGASAGVDVPNIQIVALACGGCFASVEETNHGGTVDSFKLNYAGNVSGLITFGVNYTPADIQAALIPLLPAGGTATVAGFGGGTFNNTGFNVTYGGTLANTNLPVLLQTQEFTSGASGFTGETDKGGAVDNQGTITPTGNHAPVLTVPGPATIPLRTPFALTASATDEDGDTLYYTWEQNDIGASAVSLLNNTKTTGPLFAMFPKSAPVSDEDTLLYNSPNENLVTTSPTRVFPDLQQILDNNTNSDTGACAAGPIAPP
ncbi:MAG TPA: M12 family metallo-peptidase, partial [Gaiellaceae bacterium]|nr:M12 family metallo-peptidase [Gaiellaceae bacterium]